MQSVNPNYVDELLTPGKLGVDTGQQLCVAFVSTNSLLCWNDRGEWPNLPVWGQECTRSVPPIVFTQWQAREDNDFSGYLFQGNAQEHFMNSTR
jgi:hypothetical protein